MNYTNGTCNAIDNEMNVNDIVDNSGSKKLVRIIMIAIALITSMMSKHIILFLFGITMKIMKITLMIEIIVKVQELQYNRNIGNREEEKEKK